MAIFPREAGIKLKLLVLLASLTFVSSFGAKE